jgi:hypothetical protein
VLPPWARGIQVSGGTAAAGVVLLRGRAGTATARFTGRPPALSYAGAVASLNSRYRAHGLPAPLVSTEG